MKLLLFLSAMLSALTSVVAGVRIDEPQRVANSGMVEVARTTSRVAVTTIRPAERIPALRALLRAPKLLPAIADVSDFVTRRRE